MSAKPGSIVLGSNIKRRQVEPPTICTLCHPFVYRSSAPLEREQTCNTARSLRLSLRLSPHSTDGFKGNDIFGQEASPESL